MSYSPISTVNTTFFTGNNPRRSPGAILILTPSLMFGFPDIRVAQHQRSLRGARKAVQGREAIKSLHRSCKLRKILPAMGTQYECLGVAPSQSNSQPLASCYLLGQAEHGSWRRDAPSLTILPPPFVRLGQKASRKNKPHLSV